MKIVFLVFAGLFAGLIRAPASPIPNDGVTDATAAIQSALDAAGKSGGVVDLPPGQYLLAGAITVPPGVTLRGSWQEPHHGESWNLGSTLLITSGRNTDAGAAITLGADSGLQGFTLLWPEQMWNNIVPYPWAVLGNGIHVSVENLTLVNPYQGIKLVPPRCNLHYLRNIFGCPLRYGIFIDGSHDIGRIENIHFNPTYWLASGHPSASTGVQPDIRIQKLRQNDYTVRQYQIEHLEAFVFGRTDWEYVLNTFVFGAHIGYRFIQTPDGVPNGQLSGIGCDFGPTCVQIDALKPHGIAITNGEFNNHLGTASAAIITSPGAAGAAQFVNCIFWNTSGHAAWLRGDTAVTFSACHFTDTLPAGTLLAEKGRLIVSACTFDQPGSAVVIKPGVSAAVVMGNLQPGGLQVDNGIGPHAQIGLNEGP
jgi:hypothetical protein